MPVSLIASLVGSGYSNNEKFQISMVLVLPPMYLMPTPTPYMRSSKVG